MSGDIGDVCGIGGLAPGVCLLASWSATAAYRRSISNSFLALSSLIIDSSKVTALPAVDRLCFFILPQLFNDQGVSFVGLIGVTSQTPPQLVSFISIPDFGLGNGFEFAKSVY